VSDEHRAVVESVYYTKTPFSSPIDSITDFPEGTREAIVFYNVVSKKSSSARQSTGGAFRVSAIFAAACPSSAIPGVSQE
jgi:hypothetical protein